MKQTNYRTSILKKIITTFCIAIAFGTTTFANEPVANKIEARETMRKELMKNIDCPAFIKTNEATNDVRALVEVNKTGEVKVLDINSANPQSLAYVQSQLTQLNINNESGEHQRFVVVVHFRVM